MTPERRKRLETVQRNIQRILDADDPAFVRSGRQVLKKLASRIQLTLEEEDNA